MKTSMRFLFSYALGALILTGTVIWYGWELKRGVEKSLAMEIQVLSGQLGLFLTDMVELEISFDSLTTQGKKSIRGAMDHSLEMASSRAVNFQRVSELYPSLDLSSLETVNGLLGRLETVLTGKEKISEEQARQMRREFSSANQSIRRLLARINALGIETVSVQASQLKKFQIGMALYIGLLAIATIVIVVMISRDRAKAESSKILLEKTVKERTQELAQKTELLETTLRSVDQGITVIDKNLDVQLVNERFCELLEFPLSFRDGGYKFEDFMRYNAERGEYGPGDVDALVAERVNSAQMFVPHQFERFRPDGTVIEIIGRNMPDGGIVTTYTDVTERVRLHREAERERRAAERANEAKTEFLASMSHELRTPLNGIMGFAQLMLLATEDDLSDQNKEYLEIILKASDHLLNLINEVLDLAKIETGNIVLEPEEVDFREVLSECLDLVAPMADKENITLIDKVDPNAVNCKVHADPVRLKQCLMNLLSNAVKYNRNGGCIEVGGCVKEKRVLRISVADTGVGIPNDQIHELFKPFVRLIQKNKVVEGTGVGLALTKTMIELMGGSVGVESVDGQGSTFWIDVPLI